MVFEYCEHDLCGLRNNKTFSEAELKSVMKQLLEALFLCHTLHILHRDLKVANLLMTQEGCLKLADFGLSRFVNIKDRHVDWEYCARYGKENERAEIQRQEVHPLTNNVVTIWYRAPELLLGSRDYDEKIDMWAVGCIMAELILRRPLFPGETALDQLKLICQSCGTPTTENWPNVDKLWRNADLEPQIIYPRVLSDMLRKANVNPHAIDILDGLLQLDPAKRPTAKELLDHDWFWEAPLPQKPRNLPHIPVNELMVKKQAMMRAQTNSAPAHVQQQHIPVTGQHMNSQHHRPPPQPYSPHTRHPYYSHHQQHHQKPPTYPPQPYSPHTRHPTQYHQHHHYQRPPPQAYYPHPQLRYQEPTPSLPPQQFYPPQQYQHPAPHDSTLEPPNKRYKMTPQDHYGHHGSRPHPPVPPYPQHHGHHKMNPKERRWNDGLPNGVQKKEEKNIKRQEAR
jgi:serine/threonine-protein kinase BUR1